MEVCSSVAAWAAAGGVLAVSLSASANVNPGRAWARAAVSYDQGAEPVPGFTNPDAAIGRAERFTGEGAFPGVVSPFNPAFGTDEVVSFGEGGHITLRFDQPITNDAANPFGVDFIVFGNGGFIDADFPNGQVNDPALIFGLDEMVIEVSQNGADFVPLGTHTEGMYPAMGYLDSGPFDVDPGSRPTRFRVPVDPSLEASEFAGLGLSGVRRLYAGSGGGTPIDLASSGLDWATYVRISRPDDGDSSTQLNVEIDGVVGVRAVPAPTTLAVIGFGSIFTGRRRR